MAGVSVVKKKPDLKDIELKLKEIKDFYNKFLSIYTLKEQIEEKEDSTNGISVILDKHISDNQESYDLLKKKMTDDIEKINSVQENIKKNRSF
jgi:hypothetical protein